MWRDHRSCSAGQGGGRERAHLSTWEPCSSGQGKGRAERGTRGPVALLPPRSPRLESFSLYPFSWKRALHCCDAVPCMLPLVRITAKPRVPGGLRRRFLRVPHGPSKPTSCPSAPPTHRRACMRVCMPTHPCVPLVGDCVCIVCFSFYTSTGACTRVVKGAYLCVCPLVCLCEFSLCVFFFKELIYLFNRQRDSESGNTGRVVER